MQIEVLGAHSAESADTRLVSLLIDGVLAIDAGSLTSTLPLSAQAQIKAILLTHYHFDHIKDVATIGLNTYFNGPTKLYAPQIVLDALATHLTNGQIYPDFRERPSPDNPSLQFHPLDPYGRQSINGYTVVAVPVNHTVPTVGYEVISPEGKKIFYTSDTAPGLAPCWEHISPDLLFTEATMPNRLEDYIVRAGHLTPGLLKEELLAFRKVRGYLPQVVVIHLAPQFEEELRQEIHQVALELNADIRPGYEGMKIGL